MQSLTMLCRLRQNLGANPNVGAHPSQVPPVTVYTYATQVGATAVNKVITYTQLFVNVPDQWPSPKPGSIGMGNLHKREVEEAVETGKAKHPHQKQR